SQHNRSASRNGAPPARRSATRRRTFSPHAPDATFFQGGSARRRRFNFVSVYCRSLDGWPSSSIIVKDWVSDQFHQDPAEGPRAWAYHQWTMTPTSNNAAVTANRGSSSA